MFLLAILVLILCGILPIIIAKIQDDIVDEKVVYEDVKTVQLLHELNDMEKIYLLKSGHMDIPDIRSHLGPGKCGTDAFGQQNQKLAMLLFSVIRSTNPRIMLND